MVWSGNFFCPEDTVNPHSSNQLASMANVQRGMSAAVPCYDDMPQPPLDAAGERTLEQLERHGRGLVDHFEALLDAQQERFIVHLRQHLGEMVIESKLHFSLNAEGQLIIEGEDDSADDLCQIVAEIPSLQEEFQQLAKLALLSYGLDIACQAQAELDQEGAQNSLFTRFHMCLKGPFSHFYVR